MSEYITHSRAETVALGARMAAVLAPGSLVAFTGGLGAGKTAFTEGLAEGLGCTDPVSSPTFAIVNYYRGPKPLAHFDLYRISTENDLCAAGTCGPARRACCCSSPCGKADGRSRKGCAAGGCAAGLPPPESGRAGARRAPCSRSCSQCRPKQGAGIKPCVTERKEHFHGKTHCTGR